MQCLPRHTTVRGGIPLRIATLSFVLVPLDDLSRPTIRLVERNGLTCGFGVDAADPDRTLCGDLDLVLSGCPWVLEQDAVRERPQHRQGIDVEAHDMRFAIAQGGERRALEGEDRVQLGNADVLGDEVVCEGVRFGARELMRWRA